MSQNADTIGYYEGPRTFGSAIVICLTNYVGFSGRAPRSEYWWFVLFGIIVDIVAGLLDFVLNISVLYPICALALLLPSLAVAIRRLHDIGRSGWWWLIIFVPLVGAILLLVWACTAGTRGQNQYGPDPLASGAWRAAA